MNSKSGCKLFACCIDLKKAFDTVWHDALCLKLQRAGINGNVYSVIKSIYLNAYSRVKCKNTMSNKIEITNGVHQGNVLSPLLFNVFVNDLGDEFTDDDVLFLHNHKITRVSHK